MTTHRFLTAVLAVLLAAGACQRSDDQRTETLDAVEARQERESLPPELVAHLDSGSTAFRVDDYEEALRHYEAVVEIDGEMAAGWFGVFMVHDALGDEAAATEALERARALAPGASIIHPSPTDTAP